MVARSELDGHGGQVGEGRGKGRRKREEEAEIGSRGF
jgi:hypothetical protein